MGHRGSYNSKSQGLILCLIVVCRLQLPYYLNGGVLKRVLRQENLIYASYPASKVPQIPPLRWTPPLGERDSPRLWATYSITLPQLTVPRSDVPFTGALPTSSFPARNVRIVTLFSTLAQKPLCQGEGSQE